MAFPVATRTTAFLSGASLTGLAICLDILKRRGIAPYNADTPELFPFIAAYFLVTVVVFVVGARNVSPAELKTKIPLVYFPTNRAGWTLLFHCWGRMLAWFFGGAVVIALGGSVRSILQ